jgi:hypothetical protein
VAITAFKQKTGVELYAYIDYDTFITNDDARSLVEFLMGCRGTAS